MSLELETRKKRENNVTETMTTVNPKEVIRLKGG